MKRIRLLGVVLIALIALGAFASAGAFAENPEILPVPTAGAPLTFTMTSGAPVLRGTNKNAEIKCLKSKGKGSFTTQDKGSISELDFEDCESKGVQCKSLGEAEGVILMKAGIQLVDVLPTATLDLGLLIEKPEEKGSTADLSFECGAGLKAAILGALIGVIDNSAGTLLVANTKTKEVKALFAESATRGEQAIKTCDLLKATCEGKTFELLCELGKGEELCAKIANVTITFAKEAEVHF